MKLKAAQVENFLRAPDAKAQLVLIYGEDEGLVRERATKLAKTVVEDLKDPFRVIELGTAQLKEDPSRLRDEAAASLGLSSTARSSLTREIELSASTLKRSQSCCLIRAKLSAAGNRR